MSGNKNEKIKSIIEDHNKKIDDYYKNIYKNDINEFYKKFFYSNNDNSRLKLHKELIKLYNFLILDKDDIDRRIFLINRINDIMSNVTNSFIIENVGSYSYDLSLFDSDLDFTLIPKLEKYKNNNMDNINNSINNDLSNNLFNTNIELNEKQIEEYQNKDIQYKVLYDIFKKIKEKFISTYNIYNIEIINNNVPLIRIKFEDFPDINVDITAFQFTSIFSKYLIKNLLRDKDYMKYLIIIIKYMLKEKGLYKRKHKGLSSYGIFHLVYYFVIHIKKNYNFGNKKLNINLEYITLSEFLIYFFEFYGIYFNFRDYGISIRNGCHLIKNCEENKIKKIAFIQDFLEPNKNICEYTDIKSILDLFRFYYKSLIFSPCNFNIYISRIICLDLLIKKKFDHYKIIKKYKLNDINNKFNK